MHAPRSFRAPTVLVVDAEQSFRILAGFLLRAEGCRVLAAATAEEALGLVCRFRVRPDLVLIDVTLPPAGGPAAAAVLRAACPGLEVLYSFGRAEDDPVARGLLPADAPALYKPHSLAGLWDTVRQLLRQGASDPLGV